MRSTLEMHGGVDARMVDGFPLARRPRIATLELVIDFSHQAEHLRSVSARRHPVPGRPASSGGSPCDIVAVKELEDYFFGNPRSREIHVIDLPVLAARSAPAARSRS